MLRAMGHPGAPVFGIGLPFLVRADYGRDSSYWLIREA